MWHFFNVYFGWRYLFSYKGKEDRNRKENKQPDLILVYFGSKTIPIKFEQIAEIFIENKTTFLLIFEQKTYVLPKPMDYYHQLLPLGDFYRLNRQTIVNRKCIKYFENVENRKLKVNYCLDNNIEKEAIVSQKKVTDFKNWFANPLD